MRLPRLSTLAALSTAAGLAWLYAAASRWRDLYHSAAARIVELERLLAAERRELDLADARIARVEAELVTAKLEADALEVALKIAQADARSSATMAHKALDLGAQLDALTEEVRAQRSAKAEPREAEHLRYHDERIKAAEDSGRDPGAVICPTCAAVDVPCFPAVKRDLVATHPCIKVERTEAVRRYHMARIEAAERNEATVSETRCAVCNRIGAPCSMLAGEGVDHA